MALQNKSIAGDEHTPTRLLTMWFLVCAKSNKLIHLYTYRKWKRERERERENESKDKRHTGMNLSGGPTYRINSKVISSDLIFKRKSITIKTLNWQANGIVWMLSVFETTAMTHTLAQTISRTFFPLISLPLSLLKHIQVIKLYARQKEPENNLSH